MYFGFKIFQRNFASARKREAAPKSGKLQLEIVYPRTAHPDPEFTEHGPSTSSTLALS